MPGTSQQSVQQPQHKKLYFFTSLALLVFALVGLTGCESQSNEASTSTSNVATAAQPAPLIYRPKLKLAAQDPAVAEQMRMAIDILRPPHQKNYKNQKPEQFVRARPLFLPLAEAGYVDAMLGMAATYIPHTVYFSHKNIPYDWERGIPWLTRAADAGHARAQFALGQWYRYGELVEYPRAIKDIVWSKVNHYLTAASEQGLLVAQGALARLRADAHDVAHLPNDEFYAGKSARDIEAYMWYTLTIQRYDPAEQAERRRKGRVDKKALKQDLRDILVRQSEMPPEQIAEGQRRAEEWIKRHPDAYNQPYNPPELLLLNPGTGNKADG